MSGYTTFRSVAGYLKREAQDGKRKALEQEHICGIRWKHGPFVFDAFFGDVEPRIEPGPARMIIWQPSAVRNKPKGWFRSWIQMNPRRTGYVEVGSCEHYWKNWSEHARRHRSRWVKDGRFLIEKVSLDEFMTVYRQATRLGWLKHFFISHLKSRNTLHASLIKVFGAREKTTGKMVAGFVGMDIPEASASLHLVSFIDRAVRDSSVGTGLMDEWFQDAITRGIKYLDFDLFWAPGDPREWKGFSRFKSQFGTQFIQYPMPFIKFVRGSK
ncbi:hypothetical protein FJZ48_02895 [Candidatus Uhrbacteria bacterium]|nr:hypothetical protein [Candidatus Uhrbacteria bacterium]